jgi:hypothetical protein
VKAGDVFGSGDLWGVESPLVAKYIENRVNDVNGVFIPVFGDSGVYIPNVAHFVPMGWG